MYINTGTKIISNIFSHNIRLHKTVIVTCQKFYCNYYTPQEDHPGNYRPECPEYAHDLCEVGLGRTETCVQLYIHRNCGMISQVHQVVVMWESVPRCSFQDPRKEYFKSDPLYQKFTFTSRRIIYITYTSHMVRSPVLHALWSWENTHYNAHNSPLHEGSLALQHRTMRVQYGSGGTKPSSWCNWKGP